MKRADEQDLRQAIAEEADLVKPSEELWLRIAKRSVPSMSRPNRAPWLISAGVALVAAAAGVIFLMNGRPAPGTDTDHGALGGEVVTTDHGALGGEVVTTDHGANAGGVATTNPGNKPITSASWAGSFIRMNDKIYWETREAVAEANLGDVLLQVKRNLTWEGGTQVQNGDSNLLAAGAQVWAIKGKDSQERVAAKIGDMWVVWIAAHHPPR